MNAYIFPFENDVDCGCYRTASTKLELCGLSFAGLDPSAIAESSSDDDDEAAGGAARRPPPPTVERVAIDSLDGEARGGAATDAIM